MVVILLAPGFEETEAIAPCDMLRRAGIETKLIGVTGPAVTGSHGITVQADGVLTDVSVEQLQMLVLPGGLGGVAAIKASPEAMALVAATHKANKYVAAICAGPTILAQLGITDKKKATCYPGMEDQMGAAHMTGQPVAAEGRVITGRAAGSSMDFGLQLVERLKGKAAADQVAAAVVYDR